MECYRVYAKLIPMTGARITPKHLILSLLSSPEIREIDVMYLIEWGKLFDIDPAATRVAVGRLSKKGFISPVTRGKYAIGPNAEMMATTASGWIDAEEKIGRWSGQWIVAHTAHLGRTNQAAVRSRERALRLNGFASLVAGLWCRPANFKESLQQTRDRLTAMGLESQAIFMNCDAFPGIEVDSLYQLWPVGEIESAYHHFTKIMLQSSAKLHSLDIDDAVRETFLVGESVIKKINADPLLPAEMIDAKSRGEMIEGMKQYNELGRGVWERFHAGLQA
ncbi:MAG: phenylacetic acid degradation operon negative regulatory protein [Halieaceae bacterium]|jgi:phenylacetic acid degradation operon negative regulatory protein